MIKEHVTRYRSGKEDRGRQQMATQKVGESTLEPKKSLEIVGRI
jgi:hypothetical protein